MAWKFNNESPIYLQIVEIIKTQIAQGVLKPGAGGARACSDRGCESEYDAESTGRARARGRAVFPTDSRTICSRQSGRRWKLERGIE